MKQKDSFLSSVCTIAIPAALQSMLQSSFGIVDQIMIGQIGTVPVAAVGLAGKFTMLFNVVVAAIGAVAGIMISQYLGQKNKETVRQSFCVNLGLSSMLAAAFTAVCLLMPRRIMGLYISDLETVTQAARYLQIISLTFLPIAASVNALAGAVDRAGFFLMPKITASWQEIPRFASMWNMVGLVLIGYCYQDYQHLLDDIRVPLVIYDGTIHDGERLVNLTIDNYGGGKQMGEHFKSLGHERVLYIADNGTHVDHLRYEGLRSVISRAELLVPMEQEKRSAFYEERFEEISGFSAVIAASDHYAADFLHFVQSKGISVPTQMSVAGFDDSALSRQLHPMLTTIGQNHAARAKLAVQLLIKLRKQIAVEPEILLPVKLMQRNSTAPVSAQSHLQ